LRGFAAVAALFVLVVLAGLGVALVTLSSAQQRSSAFDALGSQAFQSARAGIEIGMYQALRNDACTNTTVALGGALSAFSVQIECTITLHVEVAPPATRLFHITATACNRASCPAASDATYVERQLRVVVAGTAP
jgi:MSHA biogenesis protein MshP